MTATGKLCLRWANEGHWELEILQADPVVEFDDAFIADLALTDERVHLGDGILTIEGINRTVSYGLGRHDPLRCTLTGYLSQTPEEATTA